MSTKKKTPGKRLIESLTELRDRLKKPARKARLIYCVEITLFSGPHIFHASYSRDSAELELAGLAKLGEGPGRLIVAREVLPRKKARKR